MEDAFCVKKSLLLHRKCKSEQKELVLLQHQFNEIDESLLIRGSGLEDIKEVEISEKSKILRQSTSSEGERDLLEKTYYSPESGFCGVNELQRKTKLPIKEVKEFLNEQDVYTLHKPARKNFKSQRVFVNGIDDQWQSDLVEMIPYEQENEGYRYLLTIIDCFSKFAWVVPLKSKSGKETADALSSVFTKSKRKPKKMQTDNDKKASIIERFNRTLKEKMWKMFTHQGNHKWVDILDDLVLGYNNHYHTSIKMTPTQASKIENERIVYNNLFPSKLEEVLIGDPIMYSIKDLADEEIKGKFYSEELTLYNNVKEEYKIEKVLRKRNRKENALLSIVVLPFI
ncbi:Protein CBG12679 [Caenorhabditis briggsae]|uniref:Protein CBG12679 n=1 Tax=Caenorhabditis briggsae TaxID=6238 RepID=A8XGB7_CAEBR|nr:Protein CBG12679 [Caenorhabditis briggsae]CAP31623.1 Protein CBG12679 [Caenorhabditis briggsae]